MQDEVTLSSPPATHTLSPGKHPNLRYALCGTVRPQSVRAVSKRLVFFKLDVPAHRGPSIIASWECIAKFREGCLDEPEIALLVSTLHACASASSDGAGVGSAHVELVGFPEVAEDGERSLHVVQVLVSSAEGDAGVVTIPEIPREPAAGNASAATERVRFKHSGSHMRPNTESRHQQFVAWLVESFGLETLRSGAGVLDVAGGAGGVAFELAFRRGVPCTVVDPRPMKLNAKQRRALRNRVKAQEVLGAAPPPAASWWVAGANGTRSTGAPGPSSPQPPPSTLPEAPAPATAPVMAAAANGCWGSPQVTEGEGEGAGAVAGEPTGEPPADGAAEGAAEASFGCGPCEGCDVPSADEVAIPPSWASAYAEEGVSDACLPRQVCGWFDDVGFPTGAHAQLWRDVSIVVGMHPDQATEPIVRAALREGKPFAVVPCCVFPKSNPHRRLRGKAVESHGDFCEYLESLGAVEGGGASGVQRSAISSLAFEGRNVIVHSVVPSHPPRTPV